MIRIKKITINDLACLKRNLINDTYGKEENIKILSYARYQYKYNIEGILKEKFEEKINDKLDYSKDRFYEVTSYEILNNSQEDNKKYIYNPYRNIYLKVNDNYERNLKTRVATWYWKKDLYEGGQEELIKAVNENYNITDIYLQLGVSYFKQNLSSKEFNQNKLKEFVKLAYENNIRVYALVGDKSYIEESNLNKSIEELIDDIEQYNNSVEYNERLAGVSYDNEFWLNSSWKEDISFRTRHIEYIKRAKKYADSKNLDINFALHYFLPRYDFISEEGITKNMCEEICDILPELNLMIYRDDISKIYNLLNNVQTGATKSILDIISNKECTLNIAIDTGYHIQDNSTEDKSKQTFYEEEKSTIENYLQSLEFNDSSINSSTYYKIKDISIINKSIEDLRKLIVENNKFNNVIFSIHKLESLAEFSGIYGKK